MTTSRSTPVCCRLDIEDAAEVLEFLTPLATSSLFLLDGLERWTAAEAGASPLYVGAFRNGRLIGVVAQQPNGDVVIQAPDAAAPLARRLGDIGTRIAAIVGPYAQVVEASDALGLGQEMSLDSEEIRFSLALDRLVLPEMPPHVAFRPARASDLPLLLEWRMLYAGECLGDPDNEVQRKLNRRRVEGLVAAGRQWILEYRGEPVATNTFNAVWRDHIQVGGVYTPIPQRGHSYSRYVVGHALHAAREAGARQAVLFTNGDNQPAITSYTKLGFEPVGDYGLRFFTPGAH